MFARGLKISSSERVNKEDNYKSLRRQIGKLGEEGSWKLVFWHINEGF